jgi:hypothetical protein
MAMLGKIPSTLPVRGGGEVAVDASGSGLEHVPARRGADEELVMNIFWSMVKLQVENLIELKTGFEN